MKTTTTPSLYTSITNGAAGLAAILTFGSAIFGLASWPQAWAILLIIGGLLTGSITRFKNPIWFITMLTGTFLAMNDFMPHQHIILYLWPAIIVSGIIWGITIKRNRFKWDSIEQVYNSDNDLTAA